MFRLRHILIVAIALACLFFLLFHLTNLYSTTQTEVAPVELARNLKEAHFQELSSTNHVACPCCRPLWIEGVRTLYIITPTYPRAEQLPELTRLEQTLRNVPNVVWIIAEDAEVGSPFVGQFLNESIVKNVYLRAPMPSKYKKLKKWPRGVSNRRAGLEWVRRNAKEGVVYFADDDNSYDIRIFEEMRKTKRVSMFPVGLVTSLLVSTPIVKSGRIIGFYDGWIAKRQFPVDMAGFAVSVEFLLLKPTAKMPYKPGYEEDIFLQSLGISPNDIEILAANCTRIWVWHTQTKKNGPAKKPPKQISVMDTNLQEIIPQLWLDA